LKRTKEKKKKKNEKEKEKRFRDYSEEFEGAVEEVERKQ